MIEILIRDPAWDVRDGWHSITDYSGSIQFSLNGNIKKVFFTNIPTTIPTPALRQPDDWSCGPYSLGQALNGSAEAARSWLLSHGLISSAYGTEHCGINAYLNTCGYKATEDGIYYNGQMHPAIYDKVVAHIKSGYKVIFLMGGLRSNAGGPCRNSDWSNAGHYVCGYGVRGDGITTSSTTTTSTWKKTGTAYCTENSVNVRETPGGRVIGQVNKGASFEIDGNTNSGWTHVKLSNLGQAWIYSQYVSTKNPVATTTTVKTTTSAKYSFNPAQVYGGQKNNSVLLAQILLKAGGYYTGALDKICGGGTVNAIKAFQKKKSLTQDGICGPSTWSKLLGL